MSEKNQATVRRLFDEVWSKGNLKVLDEIVSAEHVNHDPSNPGRGVEPLREIVKRYRTAFPDCRLEVDELLPVGDNTVVARWRYSGTHKGQLEGIPATGRRVNGTGITIHKFAGDKIRESYVNWDALGMMQQLGVVTLPGKTGAAGM